MLDSSNPVYNAVTGACDHSECVKSGNFSISWETISFERTTEGPTYERTTLQRGRNVMQVYE